MKSILAISAPFAVALAAMPAQAQDRAHTTTVTRHVDARVHHAGPGPRHGSRWKRVCKTRWVNHRKIRKCRNVRVRW